MPTPDSSVEKIAAAFCEASGLYKWEDTQGSLRDWYLKGAEAVLLRIPEDARNEVEMAFIYERSTHPPASAPAGPSAS